MEAGEIVLIISAFASPILAIWNAWQATQIKELEFKYNNLCNNCEFSFKPKGSMMVGQKNILPMSDTKKPTKAS